MSTHTDSRQIFRVIVPLADHTDLGGGGSGSSPTDAKLTYGDGPLLGTVKVVPIYWGDYWTPPVPPAAASAGYQLALSLNGFFDFILTSQLMDMLQEYSTKKTLISYGQRIQSVFIAGQPGTLTTSGTREIADADIQAALKGWIAATTVPVNDANTLYFVYLPSGLICTDPTGAQSCIKMCGYHWQIDKKIFYAVVPYVTCSGCQFGGSAVLDYLTKVSSHELAESITDPNPWSGWNDSANGEIGDICNSVTSRLGGYWVQSLWSNSQSACSLHLQPTVQSIAVAANADDRLEVFALSTFNSVNHIWQIVPNGDWSLWASLGGTELRQIAFERNQDGRLELFALGGNRAVYHLWQSVQNGAWTDWSPLAGDDLQQIVVGKNADGRLELFALGGDHSVYHVWQLVPNGDWGDWSPLGGTDLKEITVATNADGHMELFALGGDRSVYHIWQLVPNGNWGDWSPLGGTDLKEITVANNADGRLELFALGGDRSVYHIWQIVPNGDWGNWSPLGGTVLKAITVASNADGRLELFAVGGDQITYHIWQAEPNGDWVDWTIL
jgi:hypothetical protein